ncbi:uncharacterized protein LOC144820339 [Lissotriton helveticus]
MISDSCTAGTSHNLMLSRCKCRSDSLTMFILVNCLQSALECFQNQSSLLKEVTGSQVTGSPVTGSKSSLFKKAVSLLKLRRSEKFPELKKECKPCEFYRKETPKNFLNSMGSLINRIIQTIKPGVTIKTGVPV